MHLDNVPRNIQPEANPGLVRVCVGAIEAFEDRLAMFLGDADPLVAHAQTSRPVLQSLQFDRYAASGRTVLRRVVEQVQDNLLHLTRIYADDTASGTAELDGVARVREFASNRAPNEIREIDVQAVDADRADIQIERLHDVRDQPSELAGLGFDRAGGIDEPLSIEFNSISPTPQEKLGVGTQTRNRCLQLMGRYRNKSIVSCLVAAMFFSLRLVTACDFVFERERPLL